MPKKKPPPKRAVSTAAGSARGSVVGYTPPMAALQESQNAKSRDAYSTLLTGFEEACRNMKSCSDDLRTLLSQVNSGLPDGERRARIAGTAQAYETARAACMTAAARLNQHLIAGIVSSRPAIKAAAPDH